MNCPKCGQQIAAGSSYCPACGTVLREGTPVQAPASIHTVGTVPGQSGLAPFGTDPITGKPYSDKSKLAAGLLQILIPIGIGRLYTGHTALGIAQLVVTLVLCGLGGIWPLIDGIVILASNSTDANGRPLRP